MNTIYPWQQEQWQRLQASRMQGRLPHALLLTGPAGLGKEQFARRFGQSLLCVAPQSGSGEPCGACRFCRLYEAGTHPDITVIEPLEGKKGIGVDQIRAVGQFMTLTSQYAGHKVVIISPAETMNINAANSLLKTLEEPNAGTVLMLVTHLPAQLPATIRSRCQEIRFTPGDKIDARDWLARQLPERPDIDLLLALADAAPLRAVALAQGDLIKQRQILFGNAVRLAQGRFDPVGLADDCVKTDPRWSLTCLYSWTIDLIRLASGEQRPDRLANPDFQKDLIMFVNQVSLTSLYQLLDRIRQALQELDRNFNPSLVLESVWLQWQQILRHTNRKIA